ncbi:hypothetical protein B0H34DRAFT_621443, partial [Crassisporium funariophilum]
LLKETARYRKLSSWRKGFKKTWRKLEETPITMPINDAYRPKVNKWICTCPAFAVSRFLVCKHLIQRVHRVPPIFFLEADRFREPPFWRHKSLRPLEEYRDEPAAVFVGPVEEGNENPNFGGEGDEDDAGGMDSDGEDDEEENGTHQHDGSTFEEEMTANINLILDMAAGLKHQLQFRDQRLLNALQREGAGFLRFARACMEKERRVNSTRSPPVSTWERSTSSAMFYRTRP